MFLNVYFLYSQGNNRPPQFHVHAKLEEKGTGVRGHSGTGAQGHTVLDLQGFCSSPCPSPALEGWQVSKETSSQAAQTAPEFVGQSRARCARGTCVGHGGERSWRPWNPLPSPTVELG